MTRVTSSRLIGREAEMAELESALADAGAGCPSLAFVAGESGVGKSRLLSEFADRAHANGARCLAGDCVDLGDDELPYAPLVGALRPLARAADPALTPQLRAAVGLLLPALPNPPAEPAAHPNAQTRLFEGLLGLLEALGADTAVLLVIEDLHWADRSTRACVTFLARSLATERVLVATSYRPDELRRRRPLRSQVAQLESDRRSHRITLGPLSRDEVASQLEDILGAPPGAELLERLWTRSGGNPLFSEELLAAGRGGRGDPPDTLREALRVRAERLSPPARQLLRVVAVGRWVDHALLAETTPFDAGTLHDALRETVDAHILNADDDGTHRFRHALLREIVERDLLPGERVALHRALAQALEARINGERGASLTAAAAHHHSAVGDRPAALAAAVRAAQAAERVHAHGEAAALLTRALDLWDHVPDPQTHTGADHVALLVRAGDAAAAAGDPARQLTLLRAALDELGPDPDPQRAATILESLAHALRSVNRADEGVAALERALTLLNDGDDTAPARSRVLAALARARMLNGHIRQAADLARRSLTVGAAAAPHARNTLGYCLAMLGDVDSGAAEMREAIRLARDRDQPGAHVDTIGDLAVAYINYADMLHVAGRTTQAQQVAREGRGALAGRRPDMVAWLDALLAEMAYDAGQWDESEACIPTPEHWWTSEHMRVYHALCRAALAVGRGEHTAAKPLLTEIGDLTEHSEHSDEPQYLAPLGVRVAELRRREGDLDAARDQIRDTLKRIESHADDTIRPAALAATGVAIAADAAQRARDVGDTDAETAALDDVERLTARVAAAATAQRPVQRAQLLAARADATRAAGHPDPGAYAAAARAFEAVGRPEPEALMRFREAEAQVAAGDRDAAAAAARGADQITQRLGAAWLRGEVASLAARARLDLGAGGDLPEPEPEPGDPFGLTDRERQVLRLVADGATNRQIGAKLYITEKTASVHVSRILGKLNVHTRTEAAAVAHRLGLLEP